jgi:hypothetical protein
MRRIATWLLVAAVVALGVVAAYDALRSEEVVAREPAPAPTTTAAIEALTGQAGPAAARLRDARVAGVLTYSDDDCRLSAVSFPDLEPVRAPSFEMCRPLSDSSGLGTVGGDVVWAGLGYGATQVILSGEVLRREIARQVSGPDVPSGPFRAVQAVALGTDRVLVLAEATADPAVRVVALAEDGRVIFVQPPWVVGEVNFMRPSPLGAYFALFGPDGVRLFDRDASPLALPAAARQPQAVAWSPDERWAALATEDAVYVFPAEAPYDPMVRIPLSVRDLDWGGLERRS